ncbi:hypothetical protein ACGWZA_000378 [Enterococcus hirae]|uniref:hypothetical protein n=1 Tax=Enterococcus TaxID=1350 RepID=UPI001599D64A|nr:hypothetical protein [Enterococcus hirae]QKX69154.1 hypothetical protein HU255_08560 [Enterococcus hirae]
MKKTARNLPLKIHTLGNQWNVFLEVIQEVASFSDEQMSKILLSQLHTLDEILNTNSIKYEELKSALIPPDAKKHFDFALIFDSSKIEDIWYGRPIYTILFDTLTTEHFEKSKNSIFSGDLLYQEPGFIESIKNIENQLDIILHPNQTDYFTIFISNLTQNQKKILDEAFKSEDFYVGAVNWTLKNDYLKRSLLLPANTLKCRNILLFPSVEEGYISMLEEVIPDYFKIVYIPEHLYNSFLSYNYHSAVYSVNKDYSLNILNPEHAETISNFELIVEPLKFEKYLKIEKSHVISELSTAQEKQLTLEEFTSLVSKSISNNIFNIELNEHVTKFNTILDTEEKRLIFSFEYNKEKQIIRLLTAY